MVEYSPYCSLKTVFSVVWVERTHFTQRVLFVKLEISLSLLLYSVLPIRNTTNTPERLVVRHVPVSLLFARGTPSFHCFDAG